MQIEPKVATAYPELAEAVELFEGKGSQFENVFEDYLKIIDAEPDKITWEFCPNDKHVNRFGNLHGGLIAAVIDIEIEDMDFNEDEGIYTYPCPCGDKFEISVDDLRDGEDIARCPSCSLIIRVIYDPDDFADEEDDETTFVAMPEAVSA
ncbi:hypothetical protein G6F70_002259 [Rhizopus microsporus]|nr:hypothetical protein G6F71_006906 [Rhizopus microsporus]KAG1202418.1 hypothetical protein G6F70_002259 [Rhizopus microsporus]KAG1208467.1 hypothetical protein G6F69_007190 [Rhizopus microsporus]KAG1235413.1 hypothetical protein G6F67_002793 [Rhizopus microsporus]KAG1261763.1 hypothetical protein G6F68_006452 [Rhizopus microsporus]